MPFQIQHTLDRIRTYLPHQASLKDFIHHNSLDAFQDIDFFKALEKAKSIFGNQTHLNIECYQQKFLNGDISIEALEYAINAYGQQKIQNCFDSELWKTTPSQTTSVFGNFRDLWQIEYQFDIEHYTQVPLFKLLSSYLDQGISSYKFPLSENGFLDSILKLNATSKSKLFKSERVLSILSKPFEITTLLKILVSDERYFQTYIWDVIFSHPGWSGFVNVVEQHPQTLFNTVPISLHDLCMVELLLEIDALDQHFGINWSPLGHQSGCTIIEDSVFESHFQEDIAITVWQNAFEWHWYDNLISCLKNNTPVQEDNVLKSAQMVFCIDDRESSLRMHIEQLDSTYETFGTPGFFNVPVYFKPHNSIHLTKLSPAPLSPKHLVIEHQHVFKQQFFNPFKHRYFNLGYGFILSITHGFVSLFQLLYDVVFPHELDSGNMAKKHIGKTTILQYEYQEHTQDYYHHTLQLGFKPYEMVNLGISFLNAIGLKNDFAPLVYIIGHGASSQNNPHYAAYDCGACSGRPGSVNARLMALFLNRKDIRDELYKSGIKIPNETVFIAGLHDTTRDDILFYDLEALSNETIQKHLKVKYNIEQALEYNASERSRKFETIALHANTSTKHKSIRTRSVSLFEPRPELNHATNCFCIIGPRQYTKSLFLDRRAFLNSYDPLLDSNGAILTQILKPIGPVCGGINLEYYFSRVDNNKYGAGSKLPHNVVGLFGVANGIDGDLRTGLPFQMIDLHDPLRLLVVIYQKPEIVNSIFEQHDDIKSWYTNQWMHLICIDPQTHATYNYCKNTFLPYEPFSHKINVMNTYDIINFNTRKPLSISIITHEN
jgi:uncharacterized protein YbcC (UPF0753/DUF2309 family)